MTGPGAGGTVPADPVSIPEVLPRVEPVVRRCVNAKDEARSVADWLLRQAASGRPWSEMALLAPGKRNWRDPIAAALEAAAIHCRMLLGDPSSVYRCGGDRVHVMTLYAIDGIELPVVAVVGIGDLPWKTQTLDDAGRLLDRALRSATRASRVSWSKESALVDHLSRLFASPDGVGRGPG